MDENQEERKRGHTGFINGILNAPGTARAISGFGKTMAVFVSNPAVWVPIAVALITLLVVFSTAAIPISQTAQITASPTQTP